MSRKVDISGQRFGKLTAIREIGRKNKRTMWLCNCDCGRETIVAYGHLSSGHTQSCGKCKYKDLVGKYFGKWKVIGLSNNRYISPKGFSDLMWICECSCDAHTIREIRGSILRSGGSKSCGCLFRNKYDLSGEYGVGWTNNKEEFYFDLEDYDKIKDYTWHKDKDGYIVANCNVDGRNTTIKMHRLVVDVLDNNDVCVDHIRHINYDNRKSELRVVNNMQNSMNTKTSKNNTSGAKGVSWDKEKGKWEAYITVDGKRKHLGYFKEFEDAKKVRLKAEDEHFGEYSYNNSMAVV